MGARLPLCGIQKGIDPLESCDGCKEYHSKNKRTNADCIRSMSDEELADWLYMWAGGAPNCDRGLSEHPDLKKCRDCWLDWLKQEAN